MKTYIHNYFYKITNLINGKYYYGIRSTNKEPLKDFYMGSGKAIKNAINKYGLVNFQKEIIVDYQTRVEVSDYERLIVTKDLINSEECYNIKTGGDNQYLIDTEIIENLALNNKNRLLGKTYEELYGYEKAQILRKNQSDFILSKSTTFSFSGHKHTQETKQKISEKVSGEKNGMYGKTHTPEICQFLSEINKGTICPIERRLKISNTTKGRKKSNETRQKISTSKKGHQYAKKCKCVIDSVLYDSIKLAVLCTKICSNTIRRRLKSNKPKWSNWYYLN